MKLKAYELRRTTASLKDKKIVKKNDIYIILDNVLDTYNVGAIFRLADAVAAKKIYLCGYTETPPNSRIKKASINTTEWVKWERASTATEAVKSLKLKIKSLKTIAIEQNPESTPYTEATYEFPIALVVGNEVRGLSAAVLKRADVTIEIPMRGSMVRHAHHPRHIRRGKESLNVSVAFGIAAYALTR
jgi:tRNA G18 (ribose-2'-O)-methylase SpoU